MRVEIVGHGATPDDARDRTRLGAGTQRAFAGAGSPVDDKPVHPTVTLARSRGRDAIRPPTSTRSRPSRRRGRCRNVAPHPVLDLGCGAGRFDAELAEAFRTAIVGLDPSSGMLSQARGAVDDPRVALVRGRAEQLPFRDRVLGGAVAIDVLHHADDRAQAARELARTVADGGVLAVTGSVPAEPHLRRMSRWFPTYPDLARGLLPTVADLERDLRAGGWRLRAAEQLELVLAEALSVHAERLALRGSSLLGLLPDAEFDEGMRRIREEARSGAREPVIDSYACFAFVRP